MPHGPDATKHQRRRQRTKAGLQRFSRIATSAIIFLALVGGSYGYGAYRLAKPNAPETARFAAVVLLPADGIAVSMEPFFSSKRVLPYDQTMSRNEQATADAVVDGAKVVAFQEHLLTVMQSDVERVRADYQRIARENAVWPSITYS